MNSPKVKSTNGGLSMDKIPYNSSLGARLLKTFRCPFCGAEVFYAVFDGKKVFCGHTYLNGYPIRGLHTCSFETTFENLKQGLRGKNE